MDILSIPLFVALSGSTLAALWDLKTTEIPDIIPHLMILFGILFHTFYSLYHENFSFLVYSLVYGLSFLGFGFLLYFLGQWGGGDAKVLAAIGFLLPLYPSSNFISFPLSFLFNVFFVGAVYIILYTLIFSFMNRKIWGFFFKEMRGYAKTLAVGSLSLFILLLATNFYFFSIRLKENLIFSFSIPLLTSLLIIIIKFAKIVEDHGFKKRIPVSKLKVGDVLLESKVWEGITERELKRIRRSKKKYVWIKEGVRFGPVFPLALILTLFYGDFISLFLRFLTFLL